MKLRRRSAAFLALGTLASVVGCSSDENASSVGDGSDGGSDAEGSRSADGSAGEAGGTSDDEGGSGAAGTTSDSGRAGSSGSDSGAAGADSGAAGADSGAAGADSGAAGTDSGSAGRDSGAAGADTGAAGADSGSAGTDAGTGGADTGPDVSPEASAGTGGDAATDSAVDGAAPDAPLDGGASDAGDATPVPDGGDAATSAPPACNQSPGFYEIVDGTDAPDLFKQSALEGAGTSSEIVRGHKGADVFESSYADDCYVGNAGADTFYYGNESGMDVFIGGLGDDDFVLAASPGNSDYPTIVGFDTEGDDLISIDPDAMSFSGESNAPFYYFQSTSEYTGSEIVFANELSQLVYDTSDGEVWYDADGNGIGYAPTVIAKIVGPGMASVDAGDFYVLSFASSEAPGSCTGSPIYGTTSSDTFSTINTDHVVYGKQGDDFFASPGYGNVCDIGGPGGDRMEHYYSEGSPALFVGGAGNDIFVLGNPSTGLTTIQDMDGQGDDTIYLDASSLFFSGETNYALDPAYFVFNAAGETYSGWDFSDTANAHLLYDANNGSLWWDRDGTGVTYAPYQIGVIANYASTTIDATDFYLIP